LIDNLIQDNGLTINFVVMEYIKIAREFNIKVNGKMVLKMVMEYLKLIIV